MEAFNKEVGWCGVESKREGDLAEVRKKGLENLELGRARSSGCFLKVEKVRKNFS